MLTPNSSFGRYTILDSLGRGAMGTVYRALDTETRRHVAIKVMAPSLAEDPDLVERFRREAMAASSLQHPNITGVLDFGREGNQLYMAMELLEGRDLTAVIATNGAPALSEKLSIMAQVAAGMALVHAGGLVHRDLKPGNVHVSHAGVVKIMDFGLVRYGDSNMTATGSVMGSPAYMSPELMRGEKADARSDVFSLGSVYYELISGRRAFPGKGITQIMMSVLAAEPEPLDAPAPVAAIVARCLRKLPDERYRTAGELHAALEVARDVFA